MQNLLMIILPVQFFFLSRESNDNSCQQISCQECLSRCHFTPDAFLSFNQICNEVCLFQCGPEMWTSVFFIMDRAPQHGLDRVFRLKTNLKNVTVVFICNAFDLSLGNCMRSHHCVRNVICAMHVIMTVHACI